MRSVFRNLTILLMAGSIFAQPVSPPIALSGMALIPGATFEMGQDKGDIPKLMEKFNVAHAELFEEEAPKQRVTIGSFYIDRTEVTNASFKAFVEKNSEWSKDKVATTLHNGKYLRLWSGNDFPAGQASHPVVFVSWYAANAYCASQGKRLPTEAEWEYAARGGLEGKAFPWGDEMPDKTRANYGESGLKAATKVGSYPANGYGLHDMVGNVWEYLADEWQKYPLKAASVTNPLEVKTRRALRGGSFGGGVVNLRVTYRDSHLPENAVEHVGFRCVMTSPQQSEDVNELLRGHYRGRAAHFGRDAAAIYTDFADEFFNLGNGQISLGDRDAGRKRMQAYFDASTFIEWDDITPPVIRVSDDGSMAFVLVHKRVRLLDKNDGGKEKIEVFAWTTTLRKIAGKWKMTSVTSTRTPEDDK